MATITFFVAITLLCYASADNFSTTMIIPDFFFGGPNTRKFVGEMTAMDSTTYYTLNCGSNDPIFWPGTDGCIHENSYTFSASSANTRFLMPNVNLAGYPIAFTNTPGAQLQSFNQTITINCGPLNLASTANCEYTSLYNNENADDKSIIKSTLVTKTTLAYESYLYAVIFTTTTAAAPAASTPLKFTASSTTTAKSTTTTTTTTTTPPPPPSTTTTTPSTPAPTSSGSPTPNPTAHTVLSSPSKAGIGIGVSVGVCALAGIALLFYCHGKHKQPSRPNLGGNLVVLPGGEFYEEKDGIRENDNSGVYEMPGRRSPVQLHAGEVEG